MEAAEKEFLKNRYAEAKTTSIAEAAGVPHAMLHYYYRTKEKLFDRIAIDKMASAKLCSDSSGIQTCHLKMTYRKQA